MGMSEVKYISGLYQKSLLKEQEEVLSQSPKTLFVFAAGNSGYDNDRRIFTPANVSIDNSITVAATVDRKALPKFSCYGLSTVHVAAPGVGIMSPVPGNYMMPMTGTSQAAPYVSRIAAMILDINPNLESKDVKEIIIRTVDPKDFLIGKVSSGGIVNDNRAFDAARLSLTLPLKAAIMESKLVTPDM
jgi:subtilisin family serine protease